MNLMVVVYRLISRLDLLMNKHATLRWELCICTL